MNKAHRFVGFLPGVGTLQLASRVRLALDLRIAVATCVHVAVDSCKAHKLPSNSDPQHPSA